MGSNYTATIKTYEELSLIAPQHITQDIMKPGKKYRYMEFPYNTPISWQEKAALLSQNRLFSNINRARWIDAANNKECFIYPED